MTTETKMDRSYLIQRLRRPFKTEGIDSGPFAFGGGLANGGLRKEALELFKDLWRFDYMGAAEFEFGAVPEAFRRIASASDKPGLSAGAIEIQLSDVQPHWDEIPKGAKQTTKKHWKTDGAAMVWYICPTGWEDEVESRIRGFAAERYNSGLKETTGLAGCLRPHYDWEKGSDPSANVGWLELDNGYMFFTDRDMWAGAVQLFAAVEK